MAGWIEDLALTLLAAEVAAESRHALQQRLRHQIKVAAEVAGWIEELTLTLLAAEVAAEWRHALQQHEHHSKAAVVSVEPALNWSQ